MARNGSQALSSATTYVALFASPADGNPIRVMRVANDSASSGNAEFFCQRAGEPAPTSGSPGTPGLVLEPGQSAEFIGALPQGSGGSIAAMYARGASGVTARYGELMA
jgi:hypothetical protein